MKDWPAHDYEGGNPMLAGESLERHPLSEKFHRYLDEAGELHDAKQEDYGLDSDPFANVRASSEWGIPAWQGAMIRANDKIRRLQTFARKGQLRNESVIDAFMDLAVYAIIGRILYEEELEAYEPQFLIHNCVGDEECGCG